MRLVAPALVLLLGLAAAPAARAEEPPAPRLDRVNHQDPRSLLDLGGALGAGPRTQGIAAQLKAKGKTPRGALQQVVRWVGRNLREDDGKRGTWRGTDAILQDGTVGGDADRAVAIGALARAAGIPTAWLKGMSLDWLRARNTAGARDDLPDVRVFLEVHLDGAWRLVDPTTARLYETYDPRSRDLPDGHFAYDRGGDPFVLVLPNRGDLFVRQRDAYVRGLGDLPWTQATDLLAPWRVYITGQGGPATYAKEAARTLGFLVQARFDGQWEENLAAARGKTLIVTSSGGEPNLPPAFRDAWLGAGWKQHYAAGAGGKGWVRRDLPDGTRVILVLAMEYGPVELAVSEALEG